MRRRGQGIVTWAVQMLEVALSRRMCCSRVCIAMRRAGAPVVSTLTPMMRPGMRRLYSSDVARKAAWGPPYLENGKTQANKSRIRQQQWQIWD